MEFFENCGGSLAADQSVPVAVASALAAAAAGLVAAATTTTTTATAAATWWAAAIIALECFGNAQWATAEVSSFELGDGCFAELAAGERDKREAARAAGVTIEWDVQVYDRTKFIKKLTDVGFRG